MTEPLIGPLTASEWCEFRQQADNDLIACCGTTSAMRDTVFHLLRMGGTDRFDAVGIFREAYDAMVDHGLPDGRGGELLERLRVYYLSGCTCDAPDGRPDGEHKPWCDLVTGRSAATAGGS